MSSKPPTPYANSLCARLEIVVENLDLRTLATIQRAWCFAQPFHNLDLLAGSLMQKPSLSMEEALARCEAGLGGPCHVQAIGFYTLLSELGFSAALSGACISEPDDHLLVTVQLQNTTVLCDVGNGQPYLKPFSTDSESIQNHLGWNFRTCLVADGVELWRQSPDQPAWRKVYTSHLKPRAWTDFESTIHRHHSDPGFGPFLSGLRAVRISENSMVTLRDNIATRYSASGFESMVVADEDLERFLTDHLQLRMLPVASALTAWKTNRGQREARQRT